MLAYLDVGMGSVFVVLVGLVLIRKVFRVEEFFV